MNRGFPSMTALLGLLAVAGYQNRDKIAEMLGGGVGKSAPEGSNQGGVAPGGGGQAGPSNVPPECKTIGDWTSGKSPMGSGSNRSIKSSNASASSPSA